jgi:hypothetical protein
MSENFDLVGAIMDFESGAMETEKEVLDLFQHLVDTGMAWTLQGSYGRAAASLLEQGLISPA